MTLVSDEQSGLPSWESRYKKLVRHIEASIEGFCIVDKKSSLLMRLLSFILFFNKSFMTKYITMIYPKVYVPEIPWLPDSPVKRIAILAHEYVHMKDRQRMGLLFNFLYLSPQLFSLLALGAVWNLWWLLALLFLLPVPSPGRAWLEFRGYRMTMAINWYLIGAETNTVWIENQFTKSSYYWMMPFRGFIGSHISKALENIKSGENLPPEIFEIKRVLEA